MHERVQCGILPPWHLVRAFVKQPDDFSCLRERGHWAPHVLHRMNDGVYLKWEDDLFCDCCGTDWEDDCCVIYQEIPADEARYLIRTREAQ